LRIIATQLVFDIAIIFTQAFIFVMNTLIILSWINIKIIGYRDWITIENETSEIKVFVNIAYLSKGRTIIYFICITIICLKVSSYFYFTWTRIVKNKWSCVIVANKRVLGSSWEIAFPKNWIVPMLFIHFSLKIVLCWVIFRVIFITLIFTCVNLFKIISIWTVLTVQLPI